MSVFLLLSVCLPAQAGLPIHVGLAAHVCRPAHVCLPAHAGLPAHDLSTLAYKGLESKVITTTYLSLGIFLLAFTLILKSRF